MEFRCQECKKQDISLSGAHLVCNNCKNCWGDKASRLQEFTDYGAVGNTTDEV